MIECSCGDLAHINFAIYSISFSLRKGLGEEPVESEDSSEGFNIHSDVSCIYGNVTCIYGDISYVYGDITCIYRDITCIHGDVTCIYGDVTYIYVDIMLNN